MKAKIHCTWLMRKTFAIWIYGIKQNKTEKRKQSMKTRLNEMFTRLFRLSSNSEFYSLKMENRWRYFLIYYFALKNFGWMKYRNVKIY